MIASLLKMNGPVDNELFKRFIKDTAGVVASYQLQSTDSPDEVAVFTVWQDAKSRDAYMASSPIKKDVDKAYAKQHRDVYRVLNSKH